jgi:intein/homing endonuclease
MIKIRQDKSANYKSIFFDGKTIRMRLDNSKPILTPTNPEIEDVAINSKCFANCFLEGTPILIYNNEEKPIQDINIGDKVKSFDEQKNIFVDKEVDEVFKSPYEGDLIVLELENGKVIKCTPEHLFYTQRGWIEAKNLTDMDDIKEVQIYIKIYGLSE